MYIPAYPPFSSEPKYAISPNTKDITRNTICKISSTIDILISAGVKLLPASLAE
ncbi:hypothetical protein [Bacillus paramycoides]|uniref:hypothetical protein n=1 Tax=Bacillus paramycoides TaxID=2026194 RepID=UPI003D1C6BF4